MSNAGLTAGRVGSEAPWPVIHTVEVDTIGLRSCWRTRGVDLVRVDNFRPLPNLPRRVPRNAVRPTRFVGAPYPARARLRLARSGALACRPRSHRPHPYGDGRFGKTAEYVAGRAAVPDLQARPLGTRPFCRVPRNRRWSLSPRRLPHRHPRSAKRGFVGHIRPPGPSFTDHTPSRRCLSSSCLFVVPSPANRTTASRVGTRQRRSRPPRACPQAGDGRQRNPGGSVVPPTRPPPRAWGRASRWTARKALDLCSNGLRPESGTARQAAGA
jgi:hypothetical protein